MHSPGLYEVRYLVAKRRVLLVDDEVTILLTMKAVLEMNGFDVETAASAREARSKIRLNEYQMVMTDMRMESDAAGREVIQAARTAPYHPAVALLTAFPEDDWSEMGADQMLVKPMQTAILVEQIEALMVNHAAKLSRLASAAAAPATGSAVKKSVKKSAAKRLANKKLPAKKLPAKKLTAPAKKATAKKGVAKKPVVKSTAKKPVARKKVATKRKR
jgi:DNA-binding response OmpR family regulator